MEFITKFTNASKIDREENLFENGNFSSIFFMQLVLYVEREFGISIDNNVIGTDEFNSVSSICAYIEKCLSD